jgi:hypothetical protein
LRKKIATVIEHIIAVIGGINRFGGKAQASCNVVSSLGFDLPARLVDHVAAWL